MRWAVAVVWLLGAKYQGLPVMTVQGRPEPTWMIRAGACSSGPLFTSIHHRAHDVYGGQLDAHVLTRRLRFKQTTPDAAWPGQPLRLPRVGMRMAWPHWGLALGHLPGPRQRIAAQMQRMPGLGRPEPKRADRGDAQGAAFWLRLPRTSGVLFAHGTVLLPSAGAQGVSQTYPQVRAAQPLELVGTVQAAVTGRAGHLALQTQARVRRRALPLGRVNAAARALARCAPAAAQTTIDNNVWWRRRYGGLQWRVRGALGRSHSAVALQVVGHAGATRLVVESGPLAGPKRLGWGAAARSSGAAAGVLLQWHLGGRAVPESITLYAAAPPKRLFSPRGRLRLTRNRAGQVRRCWRLGTAAQLLNTPKLRLVGDVAATWAEGQNAGAFGAHLRLAYSRAAFGVRAQAGLAAGRDGRHDSASAPHARLQPSAVIEAFYGF